MYLCLSLRQDRGSLTIFRLHFISNEREKFLHGSWNSFLILSIVSEKANVAFV